MVYADFGYEVYHVGQMQMHIHKIEKVPIITKRMQRVGSEHECTYQYIGQYRQDTGICTYFNQPRKICIVLDQDSPSYAPVANYSDFPCDYYSFNGDMVMYWKTGWSNGVEDLPTNSEISVRDIQVEVLMSKEPLTRTLLTFKGQTFDIQPVSILAIMIRPTTDSTHSFCSFLLQSLW